MLIFHKFFHQAGISTVTGREIFGLFCLLNASSYRDAVLHAVRLGDDTDTTAAVTRAAAGLAFGIEAIPEDWVRILLASDLIERTAVRLAGQAEIR